MKFVVNAVAAAVWRRAGRFVLWGLAMAVVLAVGLAGDAWALPWRVVLLVLALAGLSALAAGSRARALEEVSRSLQSLRQSQARFRNLFNSLPTPVLVHRGGHVLDANPAAVTLFGFDSLADMQGGNLVERYEVGTSRELAQECVARQASLRPGQRLPPIELRLQPRPGQIRTVLVSTVMVEADDGEPAALSICIDDTERLESERALQHSEALLSHLVSNSPDLVTLTEMETGRYLMANPSFERISGHPVDQVIGRTSVDLGIWVDLADRDRLLQQLKEQREVRNEILPFRARDGRQVSLMISAARFTLGGRRYLIMNGRDVTESEQARLEREALLQNAQLGIALTRDFRFLLANPRLEQMLGWPIGTLAGQPVSVVCATKDEFDALSAALLPRLIQGEQVEVERMMQRRDGSEFMGRLLAKVINPAQPSQGTIWFAEDITLRRQTEQALAKARDDAEAASRAKSAFLASTSHEIRTPLNALLGLARLARQPALDEVRRVQYIEQISDSAETLSAILTDILDLSKIEAGKMHLDQSVFDLGALITALHQAWGALADAKGLALGVERDDDLPDAVLGDPLRVRQILTNYLNNAVKFTASGRVLLAVRVVRPGLLRFEVTDTGPGIDEATQAKLFRPFVQGDNSGRRAHGGTGLGLSICRELAELMGGRVGVVSTPGQGSCFWAELPLPPGDPQALDSASTTGDADPIHGAKVLMVEDNPVNMMIAVAVLEQWGAVVSQALEGRQAIQAVDEAYQRGAPFDVVLMDVQMPGLSGHDATRELRRRHDARTLPIIALTAAALVSERDEALAAGMNDFLTKPIDPQRLRQALVKVLRASH